MNKNILSIIAPNIKNGGGKELLEYLLEYLEENYENLSVVVYLDISLNHIHETNNRKIIFLNMTIEKIKLFLKRIDNTIYFGNLPPLKKSNNSIVYMHNLYLLMSLTELNQSSFKFFTKYFLQQLYIKFFIKNIDVVACQNEKIKKSFIRKYSFNNVKILPFFRLCDKSLNCINSKVYDFCYVSLAHPHKHHNELLDAIDILSGKKIPVTLALTIEEGHDDLIKKIDYINKKGIVKITNLGLLSKDDVCKLYSQSRALVFPSVQETFGLALIEAVEMGLDIMAADLEYVYKAVKPSLVFDPNDTNDIADKLIQYMKGNVKRSEPLIENKIEDLINNIIQGEIKNVQK